MEETDKKVIYLFIYLRFWDIYIYICHILIKFINFFQINCPECGIRFTQRKSLYRHFRSKHNSSLTLFRCPECSKTCKRAEDLRVHLNTIHGIDASTQVLKEKCTDITGKCFWIPVPNYLCWNNNPFNFPENNTKLDLKRRVRKPKFKCKECTTTCTGTSNLNRHYRLKHNGMKPAAISSDEDSSRSSDESVEHAIVKSGKFLDWFPTHILWPHF